MTSPAVDPLTGYTVDQAAELLGVSDDVVRNMCARGELHYRRVGNRIRVPRFAVEAWWRRGERPPGVVRQIRGGR